MIDVYVTAVFLAPLVVLTPNHKKGVDMASMLEQIPKMFVHEYKPLLLSWSGLFGLSKPITNQAVLSTMIHFVYPFFYMVIYKDLI